MIDENRLIKTFYELVKIDSPTGEEKVLAGEILKRLQELSIQAIKDNYGNIIAHLGDGSDRIMLSAHLDTVEPGRGINPIVENGVIKSDGTTILGADNKVAVASILEVLHVIKEQNVTHQPLDIVFTLSEEEGNYGAINLDYKQITAQKGYCFDSVAPIGTIVTSAPFYYRFDIKIIGKSAHASRPDQAINALTIVGQVINQLKQGQLDDATIMNIGVINGGQVRNTVMGEVLLKGEVRSYYEDRIINELNLIEETLKNICSQFSGNYELKSDRENGGYVINQNDEVIVMAVKAINQLQVGHRLIDSWGCSDANIFHEYGINILNLGDGVENAHTVNESITITDLSKLANLILNLIRN